MINSSSSSNVIWITNCSNVQDFPICTTSGNYSTFSNNIEIKWVIPRCRACQHSHSQQGGLGCYDVMVSSLVYIICKCKEHVPEDNLEYLEYLSKKKESL